MQKDNNYYVYVHKDNNGNIFYVGKGRNKRAWSKTDRSKGWKEISDLGYSVEIHLSNLSEKEALLKENELIQSTPNLVNKYIFTSINFDDYSEYFAYSSDSPSGLVRIKGVFNGLYEKGELGSCGYKVAKSSGKEVWRVKYKNKSVMVHRIIWELVCGRIPDHMVVDHIDGDSLNNNISNLRLVTQGVNCKNRKISKNNSTGVNGVTVFPCSFRAVWTVNGKRLSKRFSINKYGHDNAFKLACEYRAEQIRLLNEQGAGYTERHGT